MGISTMILLLFVNLFLLLNLAHSSPPGNPISCTSSSDSINQNCTITNSIGTFPDRSICKAAEVVYPSTEQEIIAIVAKATEKRQKMKVVTRYSHSIPKLACPDGENGLLISTQKLNKLVRIDKKTERITVESGMLLKDLIEEAAKAGLALPYTPYWWGLTVGGLMSTGAHGSTLWGNNGSGSAVHDYVVWLRMISPGEPEDGYVKVRTVDLTTDVDLNAAKVSLGVLGVISQVTLQLQPLFKRAITYSEADDHDLADQAIRFGYQHEFADMTWFPRQRKVVYRIDDRVPSNVPGEGQYDYLGFQAMPSSVLSILRTKEELVEESQDVTSECDDAMLPKITLQAQAYGLTNNNVAFTGYPVIGYQNKMQSSGSCLNSLDDSLATVCFWDPRVKSIFYFNTAFTISLPKVRSFIEDVQRLVNLKPESFCGVEFYNGIWMRYVKASSAYLGKQADGLEFDLQYYRSKDPFAPRLFEDVLEEIEQMAVFKYGALPHWGKNRNLVFDGIIKRYRNAGRFLKLKRKFDKLGLFSSEWSDQILGVRGGVSIFREGCAVEGLCICSEDIHCAPHKGYFCRQGKVYKYARICSHEA